MGALKPTPEAPHEGSFALWIGPAVFGLVGLAVVFVVGCLRRPDRRADGLGDRRPQVDSHLSLAVDPTGPAALAVGRDMGARGAALLAGSTACAPRSSPSTAA